MAKRSAAVKATRRRIETALIRLLAAKPYGAITIADIAREADVSVRTAQRHYRSKDELLGATGCFAEQVHPDELARQPMALSVEEGVEQLVETVFTVYDRYRAGAWALYSRVEEVPELRKTVQLAIAERASIIDGLIKRWPEAWAVDNELARRTMLALTCFLTWRALTEYSGFSTQQATKTVTDLLCRNLLRRRESNPDQDCSEALDIMLNN